MKELLSPKQVARAMGVSESSLKRWCDNGLIPTIRTAGGHRRLPISGVLAYLRRTQHDLVMPEALGLAKLPEGTLEDLLKPENKEKLAKILTFHVVSGKVTSAQVVKMKEAKTVEGQSVKIVVKDGVVKIDDAKVVKTDIDCTNGVIHVIDRVILPK